MYAAILIFRILQNYALDLGNFTKALIGILLNVLMNQFRQRHRSHGCSGGSCPPSSLPLTGTALPSNIFLYPKTVGIICMSLMKCIQTHTHVLDYNAGSLLEVFVEIKIQKAIVYCFAGIHKYASVRHIVWLSPKFSLIPKFKILLGRPGSALVP